MLEAFFVKYGLFAIFLGAGIEGETAVVIGGVVAHRGLVPPVGAALAAGAGSFLADQTLFWVGRRFRGHPRLARLQGTSGYRRATQWMERYPTAFIFGFRFIYGLRTVSPLALGASAVSRRHFLVVNFVSAFIWAATFTALGFAFGASIELLFGRIQRVELILAALIVGVGLLWLIYKFVMSRQNLPNTQT